MATSPKKLSDFPPGSVLTGTENFAFISNGTTYTGNMAQLRTFMIGSGFTTTWGAIQGTLANQTDLATAINGRIPLVFTNTGDMVYAINGTNGARLPIGSTGQVLTVQSGVPTWVNSAAGFANPMTTAGDIIYGGSGGTATRLPVGSNGQFLSISGGVVQWSTPAGAGDVTGPGSSVNGRIAVFNGVTGKLLQDGGIALAALAPLSSPAFSNNPTAPTLTNDTNNTGLATTAYGVNNYGRLRAVNTYTKAQAVTPVALTSGASISVDGSLSNNFTLTLATNGTLANPTNLVAGTSYSFVITQDGTGSRTLSYGNLYKFPGGTFPTLTTTPGGIDMLSAQYDGTRLLCVLNKAFA